MCVCVKSSEHTETCRDPEKQYIVPVAWLYPVHCHSNPKAASFSIAFVYLLLLYFFSLGLSC